jgi:hypothetical protein
MGTCRAEVLSLSLLFLEADAPLRNKTSFVPQSLLQAIKGPIESLSYPITGKPPSEIVEHPSVGWRKPTSTLKAAPAGTIIFDDAI